MENFSKLQEGILSDIDSTLKSSDKSVKKLKEQEDIHKYMYLINSLWDKTYERARHNTDICGRELKVGDVVLILERTGGIIEGYGIVTHIGEGSIFTDHIRVTIREFANKPSEKQSEYDTFNTCLNVWKPEDRLLLLAHKKDAERLLKIIEKNF